MSRLDTSDSMLIKCVYASYKDLPSDELQVLSKFEHSSRMGVFRTLGFICAVACGRPFLLCASFSQQCAFRIQISVIGR